MMEYDLTTAKTRLKVFLAEIPIEALDLYKLLSRLNRSPKDRPPRKERIIIMKHMSHRDFKPQIALKLSELRKTYGDDIFRKSGSLRDCLAREEYVQWYLQIRAAIIQQHAKQLGTEYYSRQALALARIVRQGELGITPLGQQVPDLQGHLSRPEP